MPIDREVILRILGEVTEPLFPSEITHQLNQRGNECVCTMTEVMICVRASNKTSLAHQAAGKISNKLPFQPASPQIMNMNKKCLRCAIKKFSCSLLSEFPGFRAV